ncbi:oligosaccharyl transferase, archaeosortase A system-associated [Halovivax gelatinilyticus]|uniref:oligosaccharyl transferase, archaeosortase A system-associated n=1 Tax=Halovivax gelatinilyticus TaxID=2961597 RepID=UPI0020CA5C0F|nr:oligosaccharyl transferase, archaeosortase A system-associated [Halovivax gelatinilyticus]
MSGETAEATALQVDDVYAFVERYGHLVLVGLLMVFMLWVRLLNYGVFRRDDGSVTFTAIDSWYHWRATDWMVENYPRSMPFEVYTGFPTGNYVGQFGTLFDHIVVTVAMVIGLGDPSQSDVQMAALIVVPILAVLVAIPVYLIAKKVAGGSRVAGLVAVIFLALSPGEFLRRSTAGQFQHHVAEVLFMAVALLAIIVALRVAEREKPIWELVEAREWEPLKEPATYSALAGVALCLYLWTWPPAVMFVAILGVFFAVHLCIEFLRGVSPDHVAFVGVISMVVPTLFMLVMLDVFTFTSETSFGLLQPTVSALVAIGCLFMAWLAREWDARDIERTYYPGAIVGIALGGLLVLWVAVPDLYSTLVGNFTSRIMPIGPSETGLTVQEVQPPDEFVARATREFGMGLYLFIIGLVLLVARPVMGERFRAEHTLVVVWSLFLLSMAMTQVRFWYYFVLPIAIVSGYTIGVAVDLIDVRLTDRVSDVGAYQVLAIVLVLTVLFVPFAPMVNDVNAINVGEQAGPSHDSILWEDANEFMAENTPEPGNLYGAGHDDELDYYERYSYPDDGNFEYPEGAYGVMSWWDYGHLITTQAERIPHSNPFQQHARSSSAYLQAPDEATANGVLDLIATGEDPRLDDTGGLTQEPPESVEGGDQMPYVMIDYKMVGSKFGAISQWTGPDPEVYSSPKPIDIGIEDQEETFVAANDEFYDTQVASLYLEDADGMENYRLVHETDRFAMVAGVATQQGGVPFWGTDLGIGWDEAAQHEPVIDQHRDEGMLYGGEYYEPHLASAVKTFERVEGATLDGQFDGIDVENATVEASLELETEPGRTFVYTQQAEIADDGGFSVTVPYATEETLGPEDGFTESTVTANGSYQVIVQDGETFYSSEVDVPEPAIYDGDEITVSDFEEIDFDDLIDDGADNATDENGDAGGDDDENGDADNGGENGDGNDADGADTNDE